MASLFTKIINREIPASIIHEDEHCLVILDIHPVQKGHALVIAKKEKITTLDFSDEEMAHFFSVANRVAKKQQEALGAKGYNIWINNNEAGGPMVLHMHIHVVPRFGTDQYTYRTGFGTTQYEEGEIDEYKEKLSL